MSFAIVVVSNITLSGASTIECDISAQGSWGGGGLSDHLSLDAALIFQKRPSDEIKQAVQVWAQGDGQKLELGDIRVIGFVSEDYDTRAELLASSETARAASAKIPGAPPEVASAAAFEAATKPIYDDITKPKP